MIRKLSMLAVSIVAASAIGLACGGDDDNGDGDNGSPTGVAETPLADITPFPTPNISGTRVTSPAKGYAADIPAGWNPRINLIQTVDASADVFLEPLAPGANAQPNIVVNCVVVKFDGTEAERAASELAIIKAFPLHKDVVESTTNIAGKTAATASYTVSSQANPDQPLVRKSDIFFTGEKCDYEISLTAPAELVDQYGDEFSAFVQSFQLTN